MDEKKEMLKLARDAIESVTDKFKLAKLSEKKLFSKRCGVFVSVYVDNDLRGCIGNLEAIDLHEGIIKYAVFAAYHDSRFEPINSREFSRMKVHINLLSEPKKLPFKDEKELFGLIKGRGLILEKGWSKATFLPSVWEQLPEPKEFLSHLCMKAGLEANEWKRDKMAFFTYDSEEFSE
jgi:AmmeMemoRadiSam system protein A